MLINVSEGEECRIALLENGKLDEFYIERTSATSHVGNIYKGRVVNVEPSIQAAFIDFGLGRNGFLHISDLQPSYFGRKGEDVTETVGRKLARRDRPPIQRCLRRGDEIIVQIIKEGIGTKGPTLTTYLSIPGRILVMMPGMSKMGVSRKIEDEAERRRLRQILDSLEPTEDCGFIIRTAGIERTKADIQRDLAYLTRLWRQINKKIQSGPGPKELYTEGDLVTRTVRDVFSAEIDAIIVDNQKVAEEVRDFIKLTSPKAKDKVQYYDAPLPLFHKYGIEREIEMMYSRHVPLPSGGSLVIDQTEAIVAIDVNSGKFRDHSDAETTAFKTDMEAAEEIPRQLKLRDLGGVIICDFIDLRYERHRRELERKLHDNFRNDRAKTKVLRMSQFGIIELTRQRMRPSVKRSIYCDCPHCRGSGLVKTPESMSLDVMRKLAIATHDQRIVRVELTVHNDVAYYLNNRKRRTLAQMEAATGKRILVRTDAQLGLDEVRFDLFDARDGLVTVPELLAQAPQSIQEAQLMAKQARQERYERADHRARPERHDRRGRIEEQHDRFELEEIEEPGEEREPASPAEEPLVEEIPPRARGRRAAEGGEAVEPQEVEVSESAEEDLVEIPDEIGEAPAEFEETEEAQTAAPPPARAQGSQQRYEQPRRDAQHGQQRPQGAGQQGGDFDREGGRRGRRRRHRGRGRGQFGEQNVSQDQPRREVPREMMDHLPSNIWIQMPEDETASEPTGETSAQTPAPIAPEQQRAVLPRRPAPVPAASAVPAQPRPQTPSTPPVPQEPVKMAPIADWPELQPVARRRPPVQNPPTPAPAAEAGGSEPEDDKPRKRGGKKATMKKAPAKEKKAAPKSRSKRKSGGVIVEPDVRGGPVEPEPPVRIAPIADEDTVVRIAGDKHLATDEPVDPESIRKVNHRRDLDHVPEDIEQR